MLGGSYPIILINFFKLTAAVEGDLAKIPVVADIINKVGLPPIPIYLSPDLTGLYIDTQSKNIDVDSSYETLTDGGIPKLTQKGVNSSINVNMFGKKGSIGLMLISALLDVIFAKVTSQEYSISYLSGPITVFGGVLKDFAVNEQANTDLVEVNLQLQMQTVQATPKAPIPEPDRITGPIPTLRSN